MLLSQYIAFAYTYIMLIFQIAADYSCVDESHLDQFLMSLNPYFSVYTYQMLELGLEVGTLGTLSDEILRQNCNIVNPVHRTKLLQAFQGE